MMEQWHYDPSADLDQARMEKLRRLSRGPGFVVHGVRAALAAGVVRLLAARLSPFDDCWSA